MRTEDLDIFAITAGVVLGLSVISDLREQKIPNLLTGPLVTMGLVLNIGYGRPLDGVFGLLAACVVHFPLWAIGVQKGGDAKLMMGIGALFGWRFLVEATLWEAIVYVPVGLIALIVLGRLGNLVAAFKYSYRRAQGGDAGEAPAPTYLPTAPVIAFACGLAYFTDVFHALL